MHLNLSQQMKMSQQMKLAPRMIQSMEILQLPVMALNERIEQELIENVTLEMARKDKDAPGADSDTVTVDPFEEPHTKAESRELKKEIEQRELDAGKDNSEADFERLVEISSEWPDDNTNFGSRVSSNRSEEAGDRAHDAMANMVARPQSLQEYLLEQFSFYTSDDTHRLFGEYLIQHLDHNGRLQSTLAEIAQQFTRLHDIPLSMELAEETLGMVQKLEPPGVGARDYREMLLLQVTDTMPFRVEMRTLIGNHLEDMAFNRLPQIQKSTGYSMDTIKDVIEQIQTLNPYPGRGFEQRPVQRVTPDLAIEKNEDGRYEVRLLDEYIPELRISPRYQRMLKENPSQETRDWIRRKVESAKWLIESIEQRYNTLRKVAQEIVDHQQDFLDNGPEHIVPLKMQQIADRVGVHVTTVSRAVDDKWVQTPRGLFPLKRFFGGGTQTADGEEVSWDIIRLKLQELIENEDKKKPLSDDAIVDALEKDGFKLARRTITKYRKQLSIPSSRQRKEY